MAGAVLAGLGVVAVLAITGYALWPWLSGLGQVDVPGGPSLATILVNTWVPPLVSTVVGVGLAAVAGYGIGALRPLGRWSELLLPFAPWLFVGVGPLSLVKYFSAADGERLDSFLGLIPPTWLVVPALFVFTLLFRGLAGQRRARAAGGPDPGQASVLLPALPMLGLVAAATWLIQSQSVLWGSLTARGEPPMPTYLLRLLGQFAAQPDQIPLGLVLPIPMIVVLALALGALQVFYLDRLAIRVGRRS